MKWISIGSEEKAILHEHKPKTLMQQGPVADFFTLKTSIEVDLVIAKSIRPNMELMIKIQLLITAKSE